MVTEGGKRRKPRSTRMCPHGMWTQQRSHSHADRSAERTHRDRRSRRNFTARQSTRYEKIITSSVSDEGRSRGRRGTRSNRDGRRVSSRVFLPQEEAAEGKEA